MTRRLVLLALICSLVLSAGLVTLVDVEASSQQATRNHPVMLVHGLGGYYDQSWHGDTVWQTLKDHGFNESLIVRFKYPPKADGSEDNQGDVAWIAHELMERIQELKQKSIAMGGPAKVDLVVHSLGGPIARYYMSRRRPDSFGTVYGNDVGKLIEIGAANNGSWLMALYDAIESGKPLPDMPGMPFVTNLGRQLVRVLVRLGVDICLRLRGTDSPDPRSTAAQQMVPDSSFLKTLNQPGNSPKDVEYHAFYGDIDLGLDLRLFDYTVRRGGPYEVGDFVILAESATSIPGIGSLGRASASNYHTYAYPAEATAVIQLAFALPGYDILNKDEIMAQVEGADHSSLMTNDDVKSKILKILDSGAVTPGEPEVAASTATVLLLDISGSMGGLHAGTYKMDAAVAAATNVLNMMERESQVTGVSHQAAVATFSSGAWLNLPLTVDHGEARSVVAGLAPTNGTDIGAGVSVANQALASAPADSSKIIILLSDGMTNEGLSPPEILAGPVQESIDMGACIYTVGFGEPGDLDEELLRDIAYATGCEYYYASDAYQLENIYVRLRQESMGTIIGELSGQVRQGETVTAGRVTVPANQGELYATLSWPGSMLDLVMTDPVGRKVDQNYPGASISTFERLVYLIVENPLAGEWLVSVVGREVPQGLTLYNAVLSVRERATVPSSGSGWLVAILMLALAAFFILLVAQSQRGLAGAGLQLVEGYGATRFMPLRRATFNIGRDPRNDLVLSDDQVSRMHARITRVAGGYLIQDLNSTNGTFVSGQRVRRAGLHDGDEIRIGGARLVFRSQRRS